jgi:hypothetical protein
MHRLHKQFLITVFILVTAPMSATLRIDDQTRSKLGAEFGVSTTDKGSPSGVNIYRIRPRPFDSREWTDFAASIGFPVLAESREESSTKTFHIPGKIAGFDRTTSESFFSDESAPDCDSEIELSDEEIQAKADNLLKKILKDNAKNYVFMNSEKTMMQATAYAKPMAIAYIANYLRVVDGRPILSGEGNAILEFGKGGAIKRFSLKNPILEVSTRMTMRGQEDLPGKLAALAAKQTSIQSADGAIPILVCKPLKRNATYLSRVSNGETILMPTTTFLSRMELDPFTIHASKNPEAPTYFIGHLNVPDVE